MAGIEGLNEEFQKLRTLTDKFKVRLEEATNYPGDPFEKNGQTRFFRVIFDVTPDISETRTIEYKALNPIHMPGQIHVYGATNSRTFQLSNVRLVSRNVKEATKNMRILWALRGWTMPYFGKSGTLSPQNKKARNDLRSGRLNLRGEDAVAQRRILGQELLGKPPSVLFLSAYSNLTTNVGDNSTLRRNSPVHIHQVPVVITSLGIPYPSDVDYIPTLEGQPMPRVMSIDIQLTETQAPKQLEEFDLKKYREGLLDGF